ncbi:class IIb bacteriocin, lactobin A/cerein 7B family [Roseateles sp. MS654]|uniref:class IIb bacteriocin, lactobin A/cerein 7B family n=1 Tax=Roseateles sp. MS654 TaxID=3412685 RepID=UPI003C2AB1A9
MQVLTEQEVDQVHGGFGPAGAVVGGVVGGVAAAGAALASGSSLQGALWAGAGGVAFGAIQGSTGGMALIAMTVRGSQVGFITSALAAAGNHRSEVRRMADQ